MPSASNIGVLCHSQVIAVPSLVRFSASPWASMLPALDPLEDAGDDGL